MSSCATAGASTFFLVSVTTGLVWTYTTPPVYRGTATLKIEKEEPWILKFAEVVKSDPQPDQHPEFHVDTDAEEGWDFEQPASL